MYNLAQAEAKWVKNSGVEAAMEEKLRWEGLAEEVVFLEEKAMTCGGWGELFC